MKTRIALFFVFAAALAFGQNTTATCNNATPAVCGPGAPVTVAQVKPQAVPTSTTTVTAADAYLMTITVSNPTAGAITFTVADKQASPIAVAGAVSVAANTTYILTWPAYYWCPGGFTVTSSGAGLTWFGKWQQ